MKKIQNIFSSYNWEISLVLLVFVILALSSLLAPTFSYNRWDNFEFFTPFLTESGSQWLRGSVPYWNFHQHLGEPILNQGQAGVFYPPYLLAFILMRLCAWPDTSLTFILILLHLPWAALGWYKVLTRWHVRPHISFTAALAICFSSFIVLISTIWGHMVPLFSWLPWLLIGITNILDSSPYPSSSLPFVLSVTALATIGYPQILVYAIVWGGLFALLYATLVKRSVTSLRYLIIPTLATALLSMPTLLPILQTIPSTLRASGFGAAAFLEAHVFIKSMIGFVFPVLTLSPHFLDPRGALAAYQGAWILPAVFTIIPLVIKKPTSEIRDLKNIFFITAGLAILFYLFALGPDGKIYPLTRHIPIWSSFRWPFKFLLFSNATIVLTAAIALELYARHSGKKHFRLKISVVSFIFTALIIVLMIKFPTPQKSIGDWLVIAGAFGTLFMLPVVSHPKLRWFFTFFVFATSIGLVVTAHEVGLKTYSEKYGTAPKLNSDYRYLPMSESNTPSPMMQSLGLFHSATVNNAFSATGCTTPLIPWWYLQNLPSKVTGVLREDRYNDLLGNNLLRSWNVRYVIASNEDERAQRLLTSRGFVLNQKLERSSIYEDSKTVPRRAYFATEVYSSEDAPVVEEFIVNKAPATAAFIVNSKLTPNPLPVARVINTVWRDNKILVDVEAPDGGYLVISTTYYPDWTARVDGRVSPLFRTNGVIQGLWVPPNSKKVEIVYRSTSLELGVFLAIIGILILLWWEIRKPRRPVSL